MSFKKKVKISKFIFTCIWLAFYSAYAVYAIYYYTSYQTWVGILLITLVSVVLTLSGITTILSYRVNLLNEKPSRFRHFLKIAKYSVQLIMSGITIAMVLAAVHNTNTFSLVMAIISVPALLLSILVNVLANLWERKTKNGFGKKNFIPQPIYDEEGNEITLTDLELSAAEQTIAEYYAKK